MGIEAGCDLPSTESPRLRPRSQSIFQLSSLAKGRGSQEQNLMLKPIGTSTAFHVISNNHWITRVEHDHGRVQRRLVAAGVRYEVGFVIDQGRR